MPSLTCFDPCNGQRRHPRSKQGMYSQILLVPRVPFSWHSWLQLEKNAIPDQTDASEDHHFTVRNHGRELITPYFVLEIRHDERSPYAKHDFLLELLACASIKLTRISLQISPVLAGNFRMSDDKSSDTKRDTSPRGEKSDGVIIDAAGDHYEVSEERKTIGLTSAVFL